jgi:ABC-2 type transport system permease protein
MTALARAFGAELLKLRRTLALWMVVVTPAAVVTLQFFALFRLRGAPGGGGTDAWPMFVTSITNLWAVFMLPLFVALETALLAALEHNPRTWKHLFALPVPRWTVLAAKLGVAVLCVAGAAAALAVFLVGAGHLLRVLKPALAFGPSAPVGLLVERLVVVSAAALAIVVVHSWVAIRWPSTTAALATGIVGTFVTLFAAGGTIGKYWLWAMPINTIGGTGERLPLALAVGAGGAVVLALAAGWDLLRRDVS